MGEIVTSLPVISVIMPVYNAGKYLHEAIESILNQTYTNFELIIINDGSTDNSEAVIRNFNDQRIVYVKNEKNLKIVETLNKGILLARGIYVARMDADDFSIPERLQLQYDFLEKHKHVDLVGSNIEFWQKGGGVSKYSESDGAIKAQLLFSCAIAHPTIMARREFYEKYKYKAEYDKAEDYELWIRSIKDKAFHNIQKPLLKYRIHDEQSKSIFQINQTNKVREFVFKNLFKLEDKNKLNLYLKLCNSEYLTIDELEILYETLFTLKEVNYLTGENFQNILISRIWHIVSIYHAKNRQIFFQILLRKNRSFMKKVSNRLLVRYVLKFTIFKIIG